MDVFITGWNWPNNRSLLYINKGSFSFEQSSNHFTGMQNSISRISDLNNDSYPDIIISGETHEIGSITRIYENKGDGTFTELEHNLSGTRSGALKIIDIDNDKDRSVRPEPVSSH